MTPAFSYASVGVTVLAIAAVITGLVFLARWLA